MERVSLWGCSDQAGPATGQTRQGEGPATSELVSSNVSIDEVYHGASIAVDERGTEASAATAVMMVAGITDRKMIIDRPFIFLIRDRDTGAILFFGQVVDPRSASG